jgi:SAM-dependent methyltransferase
VDTVVERDPWLERWLPAMRAAARDARVLELGCDAGRDTAYLVRNGFKVVATDLSEEALQSCARAVPEARFVLHDLRAPLPFADGELGVIIASLCLHYFGWAQTVDMVNGIARCLAPGGLLLCRLNSTRDVNFGAQGHEMIEPDFYAVEQRFGNSKRFFDARSVAALFSSGWQVVANQEMTVERYELPKIAWETVLRKKGPEV